LRIIAKNPEKRYIVTMPQAELLIRKAETLPNELFQEAAHYIDYLSEKAHAAYVAEKLAEVKRNGKWLPEEEFWDEDD
jgi:hypothetical protein